MCNSTLNARIAEIASILFITNCNMTRRIIIIRKVVRRAIGTNASINQCQMSQVTFVTSPSAVRIFLKVTLMAPSGNKIRELGIPKLPSCLSFSTITSEDPGVS